jgi:hypothetical protein
MVVQPAASNDRFEFSDKDEAALTTDMTMMDEFILHYFRRQMPGHLGVNSDGDVHQASAFSDLGKPW